MTTVETTALLVDKPISCCLFCSVAEIATRRNTLASMRPRRILSLVALSLVACGRRQPAAAPKVDPGGPSDGQESSWAGDYVCARAAADLLDLDGRAFGALPLHARIEALAEAAHAGRVRVHVVGAIEAWGELDRAALGRHSRGEASLEGPPRALVGAGDVVQLLEPASSANVRVRARITPSDHAAEVRAVEADGVVAASALTADAVRSVVVGTDAFTAEGAPVTLLDAPDGKLVWTLPVGAGGHYLHVLERRGPWAHVAVGLGPYLDAWTKTPVVEGEAVTMGRDGTLPAAIGETGTLLCVAPETTVRSGARVLARTHVATWARQLGKPDEDAKTVEVKLATLESVTVRGSIDAAQARMVASTDPRCR